MSIPENPTVGVFVITYNNKPFVRTCLDSVLEQTYQPEQVVICDDASSDGTRDVIREYRKQYPDRVSTVLHDENRGIPTNLNSGLRRMETDLVSLIAGDDKWEERKLECEVEALKSSKEAQWVYSGYKVIDEKGRELRTSIEENGPEGKVIYESFMHHHAFRNWMAESDLLKEVGEFDESMTMGEDVDFKLRMAHRSKIAYSNEINVLYRKSKKGITKNRHPKIHIKSTKDIIKNHGSKMEKLEDKKKNNVKKKLKNNFKRDYKEWIKKSARRRNLLGIIRCVKNSVKNGKLLVVIISLKEIAKAKLNRHFDI